MAINIITSAVEEKNGFAPEKERSSLIEMALSEAMMFYAVGNSKKGQKKIRHALNLAATSRDTITHEEISYIVSGGTTTPPQRFTKKSINEAEASSDSLNTIPSDIQLVIAAVQRSVDRKEATEKPISKQESQNLLEQDLNNAMEIIQFRKKVVKLYESIFEIEKAA